MKLNKYLDFISENTKSGKMMIFYSDAFRELLTHIQGIWYVTRDSAGNVARILLQVEDNDDSKDTYTLIDKTDKNDMISYVQTSRFYREYPNGILNPDLEKERGTVIKNSKFWKSGRTPQYGIGRWVRHIFNDVRQTPIKNEDLENFVNAYKSTYDKLSKGSERFELVKGEDIRYWYLEDRYEEVKGQLGNSCMRYQRCQKYLDIYVENPESCSLLVLKGDTPDKIVGRALIWTIHDGPGVAGRKFMDRIYTINDSDRLLFDAYAKEHDILKSQSHTYKIKVKEGKYDQYPYMDTFTCYDYEKGILTSGLDGNRDDILELQNTDGTASDSEGRVWSEYHGEYIDEDDARYCDDVEGPVHYESTVWLEYLDIYVTDNADTVYSEYFDGNYYSEDAVRSECMDDWLKKDDSDVIEIITNAEGDTDYCAKDHTQHYIEVDGEYYFRKNYILDPYTDEYHFSDEKIDGVKYIKYLENKLEEEFEVKEKYTLKGGKFDLEKYREDLKKMLVEYVPTDDFIEDLKKKSTNVFSRNMNDTGYPYLLPGLYAWIVRNQMDYGTITASYFTTNALDSYKNLFTDILDGIDEKTLGIDKEEIRKYYNERFASSWKMRPLFQAFDLIDVTKFPTEIYKRIFFFNI
jgi:hypothetical protein